jgi:hypothetical protein
VSNKGHDAYGKSVVRAAAAQLGVSFQEYGSGQPISSRSRPRSQWEALSTSLALPLFSRPHFDASWGIQVLPYGLESILVSFHRASNHFAEPHTNGRRNHISQQLVLPSNWYP